MLPSLCISFLAGLVVGEFLPFFPIVLCSILLVIILILSAVERAGFIEWRRSVTWCAALCLGVIYWTWVAPPLSSRAYNEPFSESSLEYAGRIVGLVQHAPSRVTMLVKIEDSSGGSPVPHMIRLIWRDPDDPVIAGDQVVFRAKLRLPAGSLNPRGFDYASYVERQGIEAMGTVTGPQAVRRNGGDPGWWWRVWGNIDRWRSAIRDSARRSLAQPALGLFLGIVIGERGYVEEELQEWFMTTGTVHLLSISGSHLGLIALVVLGTLRRGFTYVPASMLLSLSRRVSPTRLAILGTWLVVTFYALLAGAELATMRAWIMICLAFATIWIGSERHVLHALAGAALLIVLHDPRAIGDISFQLSFLSVLAIIWVLVPVSSQADTEKSADTTWGIWGSHIREAILLGAAVTVITTPLVAWYFNQVPWLGLVTNLAAVPFTGIILVPIGLLSAIVVLLNGAESLLFAGVQQTLLEWMVNALHWCALIPGGDWRVAAPSIVVMTFFYLGVPLAAGAIRFQCHRVVGIGLIVIALADWTGYGSFRMDGDHWRVTFLDVGQGDSAVIELPDGKTVLIDGGARYERFDMGRSVILPFLLNQGIRRLDHIIATHPQQDHVGGLPWVIRHLEAGNFWQTGIVRPEPLFRQLRQAVAESKLTDHVAMRGQEIVWGDQCRLTVLNPFTFRNGETSLHDMSGTSLNNESVVTRLVCGEHSVVFAADIETEALHRLTALGQDPVTVLKVPHHGARSSLDREWIAQARPRYAVFSVGRHNSYGHPVHDVLETYSAVGSELVRTDRDGAIIVTGQLSTSDLHVRRMRDAVLQPVILLDCLWACERDNWHRAFSIENEF
ncbi:MAG: DNA internalization-related competence protein ComEC/Rec2 [Nitrospira sp.]